MIEGGEDFDDPESELEEGEEINFNRADGVPVVVGPQGERRPGGGAGSGPGGQRRRRRRGRRPAGGSGGGSRGNQ
jgi:polyribonucleotide nucleotidyltransferase